MDGMSKFFAEMSVEGYLVLVIGMVAIGIIIDRIKVLYLDSSIQYDEFMSNLQSLVMSDKVEESVALCEANKKAPVARVMKAALERADRDEGAINQAMDVALAEVAPVIGSKLGYLQMIANVVTLIGLLGTIHGLILSFKAVSFADPTQKQVLLTQGISLSMNNTALGLSVAIPVMLAFSVLHGRQQKIMEQLAASTVRITDWLNSRGYQAFHADTIYARGDHMPTTKTVSAPPVPPKKAM